MIPGDELSPGTISVIRIGTAAMAAMGISGLEAGFVADLIDRVITHVTRPDVMLAVKEEVTSLCQRFPVYPQTNQIRQCLI